jgi:glycosyltransferase involved in cell wall biosynthesis
MIVAQMVGRNESSRFLEDVLKRIKSQVDHIVFTDDCSTDNTAEIASGYASVYKNSEPLFSVNEGLLRSTAWSNLENHAKEGDWVIAIDCDEMLYNSNELDNMDIKSVLSKSPFDVVNVRFYHMWNKTQYRVDKLWAPNNSSRIFRFKLNGKFLDRKLACGSEPTYVIEDIRRRNYWLNSGLIMQHLGYTFDDDKQNKYMRYMNLDKGEFHNIKHIESIIDPNPTLINWGNFGL